MANFKLGKLAAQHDPRTLMFHRYVSPDLPPPPESYSALDRVKKNLGINDIPTLFPMDGNDTYGDCVVAGCAHAETVFNGLIGKKVIFSEESVVKTYLDITGGEDTGLVMLSFMKYWKKYGINGHRIAAFTRVSVRDHENVRRAIAWFGSAYIGFNVQENAIPDFQNKKIWTPGPAEGGHCVDTVDYDPEKYKVLTWGDEQWGTKLWWERQVDEVYAVVPPEAEDPRFCPGLDYSALMSDLLKIAA